MLAFPSRPSPPEGRGPHQDTVPERGRHVSRSRGGADLELDRDRPDWTAVDEPVEPQAGGGAAPLAERRGARAVFCGASRIFLGVHAVWGPAHVRRRVPLWDRWGGVFAGEGGLFGGGGHGWDAPQREGEFGNFAEGVGGQKGKRGENEGRGRTEKMPRVFGEEKGEEGKESENGRGFGLAFCVFLWGICVFPPLCGDFPRSEGNYLLVIILLIFFFFFLYNYILTRERKAKLKW